MKKSQAAMEFLVFISVAIVILIGYLMVSNNFMKITLANKDNKLAGDVIEEIKNEINLAGISNNQYEKVYNFPNKINNKDYTISIPSGSREIAIILEGNHYTGQLATEVYEATPDIIPGDQVYIRKENDKIYISIDIECNEEIFSEGIEICGTENECLNVPGNDGCVLECQYVNDEYQWRIKQFCDGAGCFQGECGEPITLDLCLVPLQCDNYYGLQGCANSGWIILRICVKEGGAEICCKNPEQSS